MVTLNQKVGRILTPLTRQQQAPLTEHPSLTRARVREKERNLVIHPNPLLREMESLPRVKRQARGRRITRQARSLPHVNSLLQTKAASMEANA
eukprot:5797477-Amphidinium_carterae.1